MFKERVLYFWLLLGFSLALPSLASAHEAYLLTGAQWQAGSQAGWFNIFAPPWQPNKLVPFLLLEIGLGLFLALSLYGWTTKVGQWLNRRLTSWNNLGKLGIRLVLAAVLFVGAQSGHLFGPELNLATLPLATYLTPLLYGLSLLLVLGWLTELVSLALLFLFAISVWVYGFYMFNYLLYLGAILAFLLFGAGFYSVDNLLLHEGSLERPSDQFSFEALAVRFGFSLSFLYTAISVKLFQPTISLAVINQFHLADDPVLFLASVTIIELLFGLCLLLGFQTRLVAVLTVAYSLASLLILHELVWPHLLIFALALFLLVNNGGQFTLDAWLMRQFRAGQREVV